MLNNLLNFPKLSSDLKFNIHQPQTVNHIALHVSTILQRATQAGHEIVIVCIGTDRSTGDSLGPLAGSKMLELNTAPHIYGTLDNPVHATNLNDVLKEINAAFTTPYILAIDACLGKLESVGCVSIGLGPLRPGAAVNKDLPPVGNAYITGIVNVGGFMEHLVLQSTRLNLVIKMADTIALGITSAVKNQIH
ncbi:hypothetical protein SDC9_04232 [bioreactor metagenome]|uniref:Spore protease YyaC n=1 Tax=bioreactor metagenome TaxID=1076179 RepID=A0A644SVG5_9ZZZZ|nr:spore protease YyaC [Negativicutes bacterium]